MSENMDNLHAALLLYQHNEWRRGNDSYDMANPKELGIAIDLAVAALRTPDTTALLKQALALFDRLLALDLPSGVPSALKTQSEAIRRHMEGK